MDDSKSAAKLFSICDYNNHVSILIGPAEQPFVVHKNIICAKSKFFQAACSERWLRSTEAGKKIKLPEVDAQVFQQYLSWVYSDEFDLSAFTSTHKDMRGLESSDRDVANCVERYLLGDELDDIGLRDKTIALSLFQDTPTADRKSFKTKLPSYLEQVHDADSNSSD